MSETVQSATLALEGIDDIHGDDGLAAGMFGVGNCITNNRFEEDLENVAGFLVDETRDTLDATTTCKATDSRLGNTLDVIAQDLAMTFGASLSESLSSFAASRHDEFALLRCVKNRYRM